MFSFKGTDDILDTEPFVLEEVRFNLMHFISESETPLLLTNSNKSAIIGQTSPQKPTWIWTMDDIPEDDLSDLKQSFYENFKDSEKFSITAKPNIAIEMAEHYSKLRNVSYSVTMEVESHHCPKIIFPKVISGYLDNINENDTSTISNYLSGYYFDCYGLESNPEDYMETANRYCNNKNIYVWRDNEEIISMASIHHRSKRHARIALVYTKPDMRGKGYAGMIVSKLCEIIHNENLTPMLYTDLKNPVSNKAYKNVGFASCGKVNEITFNIN